MSIGKKASKGFISLLYRNMLEKLIGLGVMVVLARSLSPYDFGLVSITEVLLIMISVFGTTGLGEYLLVYNKTDEAEIFKSAFWFNVVITGIICSLFLVAAPFWSYYHNDDRIWKLSFLTGGIFIFSQMQAIPKAWLNRNLMFDKQVKIQTPFLLLIALGKLFAVYLGMGVYSLLIPTLFFQPIQTILLYRSIDLRLDFQFRTDRWKEIYKFTKPLIGSNILSRITDQGDKFILGKFLGLADLGVYNIACQLADLVTMQVVMVSNNILSSVLPKYANDKDKFYNHYISFLKVFSFVIFPVLAIMLVGAKPLILFVYGTKWAGAVLPMQILLIYSAVRAVTSSYGVVINSFHLNKQSFKLTALYTPFHLMGSICGSLFGTAGVAVAVVIVKVLFNTISIKQIMNAVVKPVGLWYKDMYPYFLIAFASGLIVSLLFYSIPYLSMVTSINSIVITAVGILVVYYVLFRAFFIEELHKVSSFMGLTYPRSQSVFNFLFRI